MAKSAKIFLLHILESIGRIESFTKGISQEKFLKSEIVQDAVIRRLGIIGEAVKNLPTGFKKKYPKMNWRRIAGTRDILIHEHFGVDLKLTYKIVEKDIPKPKKSILKILKDFS